MANVYLSDNKINAGIELLKELDKNPALDIVSAMWYYYPDTEYWELLIYAPEFYKKLKDLKDFYRIIHDCMSINPNISQFIDTSDIRLISNSQKDMLDMFKAIKKISPTDKIMYTRIGSSLLGNIYIDNAILYRNQEF